MPFQVTTNGIANNAVTSDKILDSAVITAKINDGAVTLVKLATDSVDDTKLTANSVRANISPLNDYLPLPTGNTGQRPVTSSNGMVRFNSETNTVEVVSNNSWVSVWTSTSGVYTTTIAGDVIPTTGNTYNLGSSTKRWQTLFINDLNLKNSFGDYTIVEGEDDLFLYNNKKNKVYKFALIEVDPATAPPKQE